MQVVIERASVCPIRDKKHFNFNIWTACTTLSQILEHTQSPPRVDDPDILILDRGLFDSICWLTMMERLGRIRKAHREVTEKFLLIQDWRTRISGVVLMTAEPEDALDREKGHLPVEDAAGSIMNREVLDQMKQTIEDTAKRLEDKFRIFRVNTSSRDLRNKAAKTCELVADVILNWIEVELQEDVLSLRKKMVKEVFGQQICVTTSSAQKLVQSYVDSGEFEHRSKVEEDDNRVQALPVVIVRNRSGEVLRLRRRERSEENPLHQEMVIWAGGHVRKEDDTSGDALRHCAVRELQEEIRLCIEPDDLKLLGAIYADTGGSTSRHAAIVYEWRANTDDVVVALSTAEFFERRGTSLSGKFISLEELAKEVEVGKTSEEWSRQIVRNLLPLESFEFSKGLFDD